MLVTSPLKMNNTIIEEVEHIKFLAVYIDQHLAWKMHIYYICTKISKTIGMLYETRFHVLSKSLLLLHYSPASCHSLHPLDLLTSLLSLSIISLFLLILISLSLLSWFVWSCSRSNSRCSLSRILLFIWTVALATPCINARWLLFVDSKDSTFQGLMFSEDNLNKVEAWEFVGKTSAEEKPAADESIAVLFDLTIWRNETK